MNHIIDTINHKISISVFNKETIHQIFEEVKTTGHKVVMNQDVAECILISPDAYVELMEELSDVRLLKLAHKRLEDYEPNKNIFGEDVFRHLGITDEDLENYDEVEFE